MSLLAIGTRSASWGDSGGQSDLLIAIQSIHDGSSRSVSACHSVEQITRGSGVASISHNRPLSSRLTRAPARSPSLFFFSLSLGCLRVVQVHQRATARERASSRPDFSGTGTDRREV